MSTSLNESTGTLVAAPTGSKSGKRWRVKIIEAGQGSSAYYPEHVLKDYASVFSAGTHMYLDHPLASEESSRPERSIRDLVGKLATDAEYEDGALYAEAEFLPWAVDVVESLYDMIGLSIRARGTAQDTKEGPVLTSFTGVESVDLVTKPGAGGRFIEALESARPANKDELVTTITETASLMESITHTPNKENSMNEAQEAKLDALVESLTGLSTLLKPLVEGATPVPTPEVEKKAETPTIDPLEAATALATSGLSEAGQKYVMVQVGTGIALSEAIESQKAYEDSIKESATAGIVVDESAKPTASPFKKYGA